METPDPLRELFPKGLHARIGVRTDAMREEESTKWILNYCGYTAKDESDSKHI